MLKYLWNFFVPVFVYLPFCNISLVIGPPHHHLISPDGQKITILGLNFLYEAVVLCIRGRLSTQSSSSSSSILEKDELTAYDIP